MKGICNLCLQEKELIKKSHIIPEFIYRNSGVYDDKHRMYSFDKEDILQNRKIKKVQTGVYDSYILCSQCDNVLISSYEKYASMAIYGEEIPVEYCPDCITYGDTSPTLSICSNVDYSKYKLFLLSILFRASISKDDFFEEVKLSYENQETLRKMVYEGNPSNYNDFPVLIATFADSKIPSDIFFNPIKSENDNIITFTFVFAGWSYIFYEGKNINTESFNSLVMKPDNELKIFHFDSEDGKKYFNQIIGI